MAIGTYTELQTAAQNWLDDSAISGDRVKEFISLCEAELKRRLRTFDQEVRSQATLTGEYLNLPDDYHKLRGIHIDGDPDKPVTYESPQFIRRWRDSTGTGTPRYYTIVDGQFQFAPPASSSVTIEIIYIAKLANLSTSATTNWLLDDHPDIYLQGTMAQAEIYGWNDERGVKWLSLFDRSIDQLKEQSREQKHPSGPLIMKSGIIE